MKAKAPNRLDPWVPDGMREGDIPQVRKTNMAFIQNGKIEFEPTDYYTDYSETHPQKRLTSSALNEYLKLRAQLKTEEENKAREIAAEKARTLAQKKADEKRAAIEVRRKAEAARNAKIRVDLEDQMTRKANLANPGLQGEPLRRVVDRLLEDHAIEELKRIYDQFTRESLAKWNVE